VIQVLVESSLECGLLLVLWFLFVGKLTVYEFLAGACGAALGAVADGVVKSKESSYFRPPVKAFLLILWEPWYVVRGTVVLFQELARRLAGKPPRAGWLAVPFEPGGDDMRSSGRRALAAAYLTMSPDAVVIGIGRDQRMLLLHQMPLGSVPEIAWRLGEKA
jgi:multisubunit Na+/H+ antiporter MnhE subunit